MPSHLDEFVAEGGTPEPERLESGPLITIGPAEVARDRVPEPLSRNEATQERRSRRRPSRWRFAIPVAELRQSVTEACRTSSRRAFSAFRDGRRAGLRFAVALDTALTELGHRWDGVWSRSIDAARARVVAKRETITNHAHHGVAIARGRAERARRSVDTARRFKLVAAAHGIAAAKWVTTQVERVWASSSRAWMGASRSFARPVTESALEHQEFNGFVVSVALTVAVVGYGGLLTGFWRSPIDARVDRVAVPPQALEPQAMAAVAVPVTVTEDSSLVQASVVTPEAVPTVATIAAPAAFTPSARTLTALWQRHDTRSLDRAFATLRRETLAFHSCAMRVTDVDSAVARCQGEASRWTIDFQRSRGRWSIAHVTTR